MLLLPLVGYHPPAVLCHSQLKNQKPIMKNQTDQIKLHNAEPAPTTSASAKLLSEESRPQVLPPPPPGGSPVVVSPADKGRPTKYSDRLAKQIAECLRTGLNFAQTCNLVRIDPNTLRAWRKQRPDLCASIRQADAQAIKDHLARIRAASATHWRASAWFLERKCPRQWGPTQHITHDARDLDTHEDEAAAHEYQRTVLEQKLRYVLNLPPNATDEQVQYAFETKQINVGRSRLWGIPEDELPE